MSSRSTDLLSHSRWNLIAFACTLAAHFLTVPLVIRWIGLEAFGLAGLVLALCAPLLIVGTVLGQSVTRDMSMRLAGDAPESAARVLDGALQLAVLCCGLGAVVLALFGPPVMARLGGVHRSMHDLHVDFALAAAGWTAQQVALLLQGACAARQDFRTIARVAALSALATVVLTLGCSAIWRSAHGYLAGVSAAFAASALLWLWVGRRAVFGRAWPMASRNRECASLLRFGRWQALAQIAGVLGNQIDRYALGALAPAVVLGQYNAANRLQEAAYIGVVKAGEILFPHFGATSGHDARPRAAFYVQASWLVGTASAMILAPLVPVAQSLVRLWAGAETADGGGLLLRTLVLGGLVGCGSNVYTYLAMGLGRSRSVASISILYSAASVLATIVAMKIYGPYAAGAGLLLASVLRVGVSMPMARREFEGQLGWGPVLVSTVLPISTGFAVAVGLWASGVADVTGWFGLALAYAASAVLVLACIVGLTACSATGRRLLVSLRAAWLARRSTGPALVAPPHDGA